MKFKTLILYSSVLMGRWGRGEGEKEVPVGPHSALGADVKVSIKQLWFGTCTGMGILGFPAGAFRLLFQILAFFALQVLVRQIFLRGE